MVTLSHLAILGIRSSFYCVCKKNKCVVLFLLGFFYRVVQNIFWKISNICPLSELWLQRVWTLGKHLHRPQEPKVSLTGRVSPPNFVAFAPPPRHHFAPESFLGNVCLGSSQNQIQSWDFCVDSLEAQMKYFKQLFYNLSVALWQAVLLTRLCKG